jgi:hypothetical protein
MVPVCFALSSSIQDGIERRTFTFSLSSSSPLAWHWGWISPFNFSGLVSCEACQKRWLNILLLNHTVVPIFSVECSQCGDYNFNTVPTRHCNVLPNNYLTTSCNCDNCQMALTGRTVPSDGVYPSVMVTNFDRMKSESLYTIHHPIKSLWSSGKSEEYSKLCDANAKTHETIECIWQI